MVREVQYLLHSLTYIDAFNWIRSLPIEERCCYEIIPTEYADENIQDSDLIDNEYIRNHPTVQNPHFDVDIDSNKNDENFKSLDIETLGNNTKDALIAAIHYVMLSQNVHLFIYSSHRNDKRSYHIVINGFYHNTPKEAATFYKLVIEHIPDHLKKYLDHSVYKQNQQFRLLGNHKLGKDNIKTIDPTTQFIPIDEYGHPHKDIRNIDPITIWSSTNYDDQISLLRHFEASLITFTAGCVQLPSFISHAKIPKKNANVISTWFKSKGITPKDKPSNELKVPSVSSHQYLDCNEYYEDIVAVFQKSPLSNDYDIGDTKKTYIHLRRKHPSLFPVCGRIHDKENSFIFVTYSGTIYWRCYRSESHDSSLYLGKITQLNQESSQFNSDSIKNTEENSLEDRENLWMGGFNVKTGIFNLEKIQWIIDCTRRTISYFNRFYTKATTRYSYY